MPPESSRDTSHSSGLRQRAEDWLVQSPSVANMEAGAADALKTLHELQVHKVELDLQNEELQRAQAEAAAERDRYARLFQLAPIGFVALGLDGSIIEANEAAAALLKRHRPELHGQSLESFLAPTSRPLFRGLLAHAHAAGQTAELELGLSDGAARFVQAEVSADPTEPSVMVALLDITARKASDAALQSASNELTLAGHAKSSFLSRMSHELRTPLNAALGFAQLLRLDAGHPLDATQSERAMHIERAGTQLVALIDEIMDVSRIESGRIDLSIGPVLAEGLFDECLPMVLPRAAASGVKVVRAPPPSTPCVMLADAKRVRQVLVNVLSNAVKYNRLGGEVRVSCEPDGSAVKLIVADTGVGMSAQQQEHLFQPFERLGAEYSEVEGAGLGLVIARQLIEAMHGSIAIRSEPGRGTSVTLTLPRAEHRQVVSPAPVLTAPSTATTTRHTVLYIEDNAINRTLMEAIFEPMQGFALRVAANGEQGITAARELRPSLAIIDLNLPDMAGTDVLKALRESPETRDCVCVALSADVALRSQAEAARAGFLEFWPKPLNVDALRGRLNALLA